jgi:hypothetical protein
LNELFDLYGSHGRGLFLQESELFPILMHPKVNLQKAADDQSSRNQQD